MSLIFLKNTATTGRKRGKIISVPTENRQRGQREGTRRQMGFSNTERRRVMEIRGRGLPHGLHGVPRILPPPDPAPQDCSLHG